MESMAKYRHRTFEMFDFLQEATQALLSKGRRPSLVKTDANLWTFLRLNVSQTDNVIHVTFKPVVQDAATALEDLGKDLNLMANSLGIDSQVVLDFEGLHEFCPESIALLAVFSRRLQSKGSRLTLCNLEPSVRESFFPQRNA
jgi:hypothetical protein